VPRDIKTVLEIGVLGGASLRTWRDYFTSARVFGIDNEPSCMVMGEERIQTMCFNAYDLVLLFPMLDEIAPIDFLIDDAKHFVPLQIGLFSAAWPFVRDGGVYAIEDIQDSDLETMCLALAKVTTVTDLRVVTGKQGYSMIIMRKA
jgi:hypothetical protein